MYLTINHSSSFQTLLLLAIIIKMSAKITPIEFDFEFDFEYLFYDVDIESPMHSTSERPRFMSPKPTSPKPLKPLAVRQTSPLPSELGTSELGKRDFIIAFGDDAEEQRYGQKIEGDFFATNVGHGVFSPIKAEQKPPASGLTAEVLQAATDSVIQDFRADFAGILRRERDSESKYDVNELLEWCEYYCKNRNLFNV